MQIEWEIAQTNRKARKDSDLTISRYKRGGEVAGVSIVFHNGSVDKILSPFKDRLLIGMNIEKTRLYFSKSEKGRKVSPTNKGSAKTMSVAYGSEYGLSLLRFVGEHKMVFDAKEGLYYIELEQD